MNDYLENFRNRYYSQVLTRWYFRDKTIVEISNELGLPTGLVTDITTKEIIPQEVLEFLGITQEDINKKRTQ